jgi:hypothetical protein
MEFFSYFSVSGSNEVTILYDPWSYYSCVMNLLDFTGIRFKHSTFQHGNLN